MKKSVVIFFLLLGACASDDIKKEEPFNDPNWLKLEIPNGREAYAVAGDLDDTLLVTTLTKVYYTTDQGETWIASYDFQGPASGLLQSNDTIYALRASGTDEEGVQYASLAQYFTLDYGNHWKRTHKPNLIKRIGLVQSSAGAEYFLKRNTTPTAPGASSYFENPTEIMRTFDGNVENTLFPFTHLILNLHMDSKDRLYVAVSGGEYQEEKNNFVCCAVDAPAIVYVSKQPKH